MTDPTWHPLTALKRQVAQGGCGTSAGETLLATVVVIAVAVLVGFRPTAGALEWFAAVGVLAMITLALTWLSVALGLVAKSVETASNTPVVLMLPPFLGSGFVPTSSMPTGLRQ